MEHQELLALEWGGFLSPSQIVRDVYKVGGVCVCEADSEERWERTWDVYLCLYLIFSTLPPTHPCSFFLSWRLGSLV